MSVYKDNPPPLQRRGRETLLRGRRRHSATPATLRKGAPALNTRLREELWERT